jgi:hypothetical protein
LKKVSNASKNLTTSLILKATDVILPSSVSPFAEILDIPIIENESVTKRSEFPDFFDKIKENFRDKIEDIHRVHEHKN